MPTALAQLTRQLHYACLSTAHLLLQQLADGLKQVGGQHVARDVHGGAAHVVMVTQPARRKMQDDLHIPSTGNATAMRTKVNSCGPYELFSQAAQTAAWN